ncbi:DUF4153 domain-containing protein [Fuscibacter oryzae]|uniref:DUF4173 domain-containing protein n=1 Tax=Fuscibacter oryzae TaxID=2803939 RepID=A0A8J7MZH0_9RHOB|nr:DUF4173 domain-containing protein [Fuscibacter oryzae]MBL4929714.1 DUF4173 domain-containing protein [Fuscibacter oryzae]
MTTKRLTIHGLPTVLARDGWWLGPEPDAVPDAAPEAGSTGSGAMAGRSLSPLASRGLGLVVLVVLGDLLFWGQVPGLSLAVFAGAVFGLATMQVPGLAKARPAGLLVLGLLPVVEYVQALSLAFLALSLTTAIVWAHLPGLTAGGKLVSGLRLLARLPLGGILGLLHLVMNRSARPGSITSPRSFLRNWAVPLGGTLVFAALLADANPLIEQALSLNFDAVRLINRAAFWAGIALLAWPLLDLPTPVHLAARAVALPGINAGSVLRALVMFNLLIGLQSGLDLSILLGGAQLPRGMSFAAYAHRGAYPLLATALLAWAFALSARPYLGEHRLIRPLMLLWLGQNMVLCASALLRLDLYVQAYGLTYLRIRAGIWVVLVAAGLWLCLWQVVQRRSNLWLLSRVAVMGLATLYLCSFVNFAALIVRHNLAQPRGDAWYTCALGPTAAAAIAEAMAQNPQLTLDLPGCAPDAPQITGWRDWGFRNWRVDRYLAAHPVVRFVP